MKRLELFFRTRNYCVIEIPSDITDIRDFVIDKIVGGDIENFIKGWLDFEIEDFELDEEDV